ncbi:hypothetical protein Aph01nite_34270 [Acrocarpospora phusangensis]|uniref:FtsK gamma domain-containing protein n=2 Tax=Acrocarpospora phusangensis TaxID=1070424 RepID=A0A919QA22_9ACTN|nr:hypothetical protein Aph01nite_34270 [Acrocarpospora phusangensis]
MSQVAAREVSKVLLYASPWAIGLLLLGLGAAFHFTLRSDDPQVVAWTTAGITLCALVLTWLTWHQSHARSTTGRAHTTLTTALAGMWVCAATISGPLSTATGRAYVIGGVTLALSFNIRTVIRVKQVDVPAIANDPLTALFGTAAAKAGMPAIEARTTARTEHKIEADIQLEAGKQVADDFQRRAPYIESGMGLPPGSVTTSIDPDDASKAKAVFSDPRVMKRPLPWPGPSLPGGSIADALRIGLWQDLDDVLYVIVGHHLQLMGMSGAGKSIGGCWNILGDAITRVDVAVFAADVTKGRQTLGPLEESLHRFEDTTAGARAMLRDLQAEVKNRTNQLSARGLTKWRQGCGLTYWIIWLEECPDILDALTDSEMEQFLSLVKALRSAGGTVVLSLQRSDYTQMPTIARGQLGNMCFGVANSGDASFGLSEAMEEAGARPELWENGQPGMAYLGAPTIPRDRIAMPLRTFAWGMVGEEFDDEVATAAMREHAALFPAAAKQVDEGTARLAKLVQSPASAQATATAVVDQPPIDRELLVQAAELVVTTQFGSPQMLQRKLRVPWEQARELVAALQDAGVLGPARENAAPKVLRGADELDEVLDDLRGHEDDDQEEDGVDDDEDVVGEYLPPGDDPDPDVQAGMDDEIPDIDEGEPPWTFDRGESMTPEARHAALITLLQDWWDGGRRDFQTGDLSPLWSSTDMTRQWAQGRLRKLRGDEVLGYDEDAQRHLMLTRPE